MGRRVRPHRCQRHRPVDAAAMRRNGLVAGRPQPPAPADDSTSMPSPPVTSGPSPPARPKPASPAGPSPSTGTAPTGASCPARTTPAPTSSTPSKPQQPTTCGPSAAMSPTAASAPSPSPCVGTARRGRLSPTLDSFQGFDLSAVDATTPTNAWAVGTNIASPIFGGGGGTTIRWNGTAWEEVPGRDRERALQDRTGRRARPGPVAHDRRRRTAPSLGLGLRGRSSGTRPHR